MGSFCLFSNFSFLHHSRFSAPFADSHQPEFSLSGFLAHQHCWFSRPFDERPDSKNDSETDCYSDDDFRRTVFRLFKLLSGDSVSSRSRIFHQHYFLRSRSFHDLPQTSGNNFSHASSFAQKRKLRIFTVSEQDSCKFGKNI